jgi:hypothetical protein
MSEVILNSLPTGKREVITSQVQDKSCSIICQVCELMKCGGRGQYSMIGAII